MYTKIYRGWVKPIYADIRDFVLDTLFPINCLVCATEGKFICDACKMKFARLEHQICIACRKPAPFGITHAGCSTSHGVDGLISVLNYHDENVSNGIITGKYNFIPGMFAILADVLVQKIDADYHQFLDMDDIWYACPVPLSPFRKRWRGFNQAEVLCDEISGKLGLIKLCALERNKNTKTQKDLKRAERIKNMEDAFRLRPKIDVHGKNIILVDDVTTTGSTLLEAAKALKRNGAKQVWCLTIARD
jgi:ComF family protein